ncbi:uncharacterized protein STEHIDRAFT_167152 [Stereum hirsutum FP-91666 SS1]|uniref:uncharacterized protein n=1 Tax=Stereum hirsutum (strain FP-91666) TaxID=721885 RepID=UPI000440FA26|nr:uncharacterized protein STEHIDRAFT_167152 [Stereum hirsutum FP-91666 SS1]EIM89315.1 hypothetical protein STEHIDRAFT_167152 [Stereum hirsutum FP-91666 SS1]
MASLALCSHSHAALVRPLLYEHITILSGVLRQYKHLYGSQRKYEHGHLFALVTTILSRPSLFGPFVKSINNITRTEWSSDLGEISLFFRAMTNLRSLRFGHHSSPSPVFISQVCVSGISASLEEFECNRTPAVPSIFEFLRSHPNLSVLRLGTVRNQHQNGQDESQHRFESISESPRAQLPNLTSLELKVGSGMLAFSTELLLRVSNTHLERLSIAYSDPSSTRLNGTVLNHLDALYHVCSARLNHLIIEDTPHQCPQSFSWIISNVLPRIPHLRTLELRQAQYKYRTNESQPQQVIHTDSLTLTSGGTDVLSAFPTKLETVRWVGADAYFPSVRSGLSPLGASNAKALFELFSSLKVVEYHERGYVFIFRRLEGGVIKRQTMRFKQPGFIFA